MANYYDYSVRHVWNRTTGVGVGIGSSPDGKTVVCVSLEGEPINPTLPEGWQTINWSALTLEAAQHLYECLHCIRHLWEET